MSNNNEQNSGSVIEIQFTDEEIEDARIQRHIEREQQYEKRRQQELQPAKKEKRRVSEFTKRDRKKLAIRLIWIMTPFLVVLLVGITLLAVGQETSSTPLATAGGIVTCIGIFSLIIISAIIQLKLLGSVQL